MNSKKARALRKRAYEVWEQSNENFKKRIGKEKAYKLLKKKYITEVKNDL